MVPALLAPAASFAGKTLASLGIWKAGSAGLSKVAPKVRGAVDDLTGWIGRNPGTAGKGALGIGAVATVRSTLADLGIKDNQLQLAVIVGLALAAVAAVGQLVDFQIGGS